MGDMNDTDESFIDDPDQGNDDLIPCFMSNGAPEGHSAIEALEAARTLGEWLSNHPDERVWALKFGIGQINGMQKVIIRDTSGQVVLYTEASGTDVAKIYAAIGVSHDATEHINVLMSDGLDMIQAGEAAVLLNL